MWHQVNAYKHKIEVISIDSLKDCVQNYFAKDVTEARKLQLISA
jgi:hypothetical protein